MENELLRAELQVEKQKFQTDLEVEKDKHELLRAELQVEKQKNNLLQEKLDRISEPHHDISQWYETEIMTVRQHAETLQQELDEEAKAHKNSLLKCVGLLDSVNAEWADLRHKMTKKEEYYKRQLEELEKQLNIQISLNVELSEKLEV